MTDIPTLIARLENVGAEWSTSEQSPSFYKGLCRQAAAALKELTTITIGEVQIAQQYPTLRDQFAMAALTGLALNPKAYDYSHEGMAQWAYKAADAMLEARKP